MATKASYGLDGPEFMRGFLGGGVALAVAGEFVSLLPLPGWAILSLRIVLWGGGAVCLMLACIMLTYSLHGKMRMRDYMLSLIPWRGDEAVLDIGTGRGLLAIGATHRTDTPVVAIDLWDEKDLSGNTFANAARNAQIENVADKITWTSADATALSFASERFDVVLSLLCLHNIEDANKRTDACNEIARVLKPGGVALIGDYVPTTGYAADFARAGLYVQFSRPHFAQAQGPMWLVVATKPT